MEPKWQSGPMPFALGMALVENPPALEKYAALPQEAKQQLIARAADCTTRTQMQAYVQHFMEH